MTFRIALTGWRFARAMRAGRLRLVFQPKVSMADGRPVGFEGLVRWQERRAFIPPSEFIPHIEMTRRAKSLDAYVLDGAARQARALSEAGVPMQIAVNLSPSAFDDPGLVARILDLLERHELPTGALQIEMTERALDESKGGIDVIERLAGNGIGVTLDDFGIGYSSLERLVRLQISGMKIDRSFVRALETHERAAAVVYSAAELAHALDLSITAEGIEDEPTWHHVRALGLDCAQGFLIARPMPGEELIDWLRENPHVMTERRSGHDRRRRIDSRPGAHERRSWRERRSGALPAGVPHAPATV
jgi:EAL domain-containing protein (putative c-di-GMP-specific phosphodiesterase class I)